jgi:hypothetical protein
MRRSSGRSQDHVRSSSLGGGEGLPLRPRPSVWLRRDGYTRARERQPGNARDRRARARPGLWADPQTARSGRRIARISTRLCQSGSTSLGPTAWSEASLTLAVRTSSWNPGCAPQVGTSEVATRTTSGRNVSTMAAASSTDSAQPITSTKSLSILSTSRRATDERPTTSRTRTGRWSSAASPEVSGREGFDWGRRGDDAVSRKAGLGLRTQPLILRPCGDPLQRPNGWFSALLSCLPMISARRRSSGRIPRSSDEIRASRCQNGGFLPVSRPAVKERLSADPGSHRGPRR